MQRASPSSFCGFFLYFLICNWFSSLLLPHPTVFLLCPSGVHGQREVPLRKWLWCFPQEAWWEWQRLHRLREDHLPVWRPEKKLQRGPWQVRKDQRVFFLVLFSEQVLLRSGLLLPFIAQLQWKDWQESREKEVYDIQQRSPARIELAMIATLQPCSLCCKRSVTKAIPRNGLLDCQQMIQIQINTKHRNKKRGE